MANHLLHSPISAVHLLAVLLAVASGTAVLLLPKGTRRHRRLGWVYVASMSVGLLSAFGIYALFGSFGIVHWGAVGSAGALLLGVGAALGRRVVPAWQRWHYLGMGASVVGLYTALVVEAPTGFFRWRTSGKARWPQPGWCWPSAAGCCIGATLPGWHSRWRGPVGAG